MKGTIQVDVDGIWTLYQYYGIKTEIFPDVVFTEAIPRILALLDEYNVKATFFIVGLDCEIPEKRVYINEITTRGHEIANHTFSHPVNFSSLKKEEKRHEIEKTDKILRQITKDKIVGFRAPGYDFDLETIEILEENNYLYDSSILPTYLNPLLRFMERILSKSEIPRRQFGSFLFGFLPLKKFNLSNKWILKVMKRKIIEIPVSVSPLFRIPFHSSFIGLSNKKVFDFLYSFFVKKRIELNYLFHCIDLVDFFHDKRIPVHKCVFKSLDYRISLTRYILSRIVADYEIVRTKDLCL